MSFTFDPTLPTHKDWVRFYIADYSAPGIYADETIQALLDTGQDLFYVAADLCLQQMARYAPVTDIQDGDLQKQRSQVYDHWKQLEAQLRKRSLASSMAAGPIVPEHEVRERLVPDESRRPGERGPLGPLDPLDPFPFVLE